MPLDVSLELNNRIWSMLEGNPVFAAAFKPNNRLKETELLPALRERMKRAGGAGPADFPMIRIEASDETDNERAPRTFGMSAENFTPETCDYGVPMVLVFTITVLHDALTKSRLQDRSAVESSIRAAIFSRGPNLGFRWVSSFTYRSTKHRVEISKDTGGVERPIAQFRLTVTARPMLSQITS